jgi:lactoylglutathione lyase
MAAMRRFYEDILGLISPPTDQVFGHRTLFFRDPDGNLLEVFADI